MNFEFSVKEEKPVYVFPEISLHEGLKIPSSIEKAISYSDDRVLRLVKKDCLVISGEKAYFKFTVPMLAKIENALKMEGGTFFPQYFNDLLELLKIFKENLDKKLVSFIEMEEEGKEESI